MAGEVFNEKNLFLNAYTITPSSSSDLIQSSVVYVGGGGTGKNVKVTAGNSGTVTFANVPSGTTLPVIATRVWADLTTATDLIGMY